MFIEKKFTFNVDKQYLIQLVGFFIGIIILSIVCFIDDKKNIPAIVKLIAQIIAASIVVLFGTRIDIVNIPFVENMIPINEVLSYIITII